MRRVPRRLDRDDSPLRVVRRWNPEHRRDIVQLPFAAARGFPEMDLPSDFTKQPATRDPDGFYTRLGLWYRGGLDCHAFWQTSRRCSASHFKHLGAYLLLCPPAVEDRGIFKCSGDLCRVARLLDLEGQERLRRGNR